MSSCYTYRGQLDAEWVLPRSGNALCDIWIFGKNAWIWLVGSWRGYGNLDRSVKVGSNFLKTSHRRETLREIKS
jgi:hypothetical protein